MDEQKKLIRDLLFSSTNVAAMTSHEIHLFTTVERLIYYTGIDEVFNGTAKESASGKGFTQSPLKGCLDRDLVFGKPSDGKTTGPSCSKGA